jgi:hypothetical protein
MKEQTMHILTQLMNDNIGNRLTPALATGILTLLDHSLSQIEAQAKTLADKQHIE